MVIGHPSWRLMDSVVLTGTPSWRRAFEQHDQQCNILSKQDDTLGNHGARNRCLSTKSRSVLYEFEATLLCVALLRK